MSSTTSNAQTQVEQLSEGDYIHTEKSGELMRVVKNTADWDDSKDEYTGSVTFEDVGIGNQFEEHAGDVAYRLVDDIYHKINEDIVDNPSEILIEFASRELTNYLSRLGHNHDYNGIDKVERLRDIQAAAQAYSAKAVNNRNPGAYENVYVFDAKSRVWLIEAESVDEAEEEISKKFDPPLDKGRIYYEGTLGESLRSVDRDGIAVMNT